MKLVLHTCMLFPQIRITCQFWFRIIASKASVERKGFRACIYSLWVEEPNQNWRKMQICGSICRRPHCTPLHNAYMKKMIVTFTNLEAQWNFWEASSEKMNAGIRNWSMVAIFCQTVTPKPSSGFVDPSNYLAFWSIFHSKAWRGRTRQCGGLKKGCRWVVCEVGLSTLQHTMEYAHGDCMTLHTFQKCSPPPLGLPYLLLVICVVLHPQFRWTRAMRWAYCAKKKCKLQNSAGG